MQVLDVSVEGPRSASGVFKVLSKRLEGTGDLELVAQRSVASFVGKVSAEPAVWA